MRLLKILSVVLNLYLSPHYINVPQEKYDVIESQAAEIEKLKEEVNQTIEKNVELNQKVSENKDKKLSMMFHLILLLQKLRNLANWQKVLNIKTLRVLERCRNIKKFLLPN